jgi:hypothetical protein
LLGGVAELVGIQHNPTAYESRQRRSTGIFLQIHGEQGKSASAAHIGSSRRCHYPAGGAVAIGDRQPLILPVDDDDPVRSVTAD